MSLSVTASDLDRLFADCGSPATLQVIRPAYDPESQTISEVVQDTDIVVIPGQREQQPADGTAGAHRIRRSQFLVRISDLADLAEGAVRRLNHAGITYEYVSAVESPQSGLAMLTVRR